MEASGQKFGPLFHFGLALNKQRIEHTSLSSCALARASEQATAAFRKPLR
jgi:hypothetical protein